MRNFMDAKLNDQNYYDNHINVLSEYIQFILSTTSTWKFTLTIKQSAYCYKIHFRKYSLSNVYFRSVFLR